MSDSRLLLDSYLKTLKLPTMRTEYEAMARQCSQANAPLSTADDHAVGLAAVSQLLFFVLLCLKPRFP